MEYQWHKDPLIILGAGYGKLDVTEKVIAQIQAGALDFQVKNEVLGDGWDQQEKALTIVYQYGDWKPVVYVAKQHEQVKIKPEHANHQAWAGAERGRLTVLGATYGITDYTQKVADRVHNNVLEVTANADQLGDGWPGYKKALVIVHRDAYGDNIVNICEENQSLRIAIGDGDKHIKIFAASYGLLDMTNFVRSQVSRGQYSFPVNNDTLPDGWPGRAKTLSIIYQIATNKPEVLVAKEHETLNLNLSPAPTVWVVKDQELFIIGASWGLVDITDVLASKVKNNSLEITVNDQNLAPGWEGQAKALLLAYQEPHLKPKHIIVEEGQSLKLPRFY